MSDTFGLIIMGIMLLAVFVFALRLIRGQGEAILGKGTDPAKQAAQYGDAYGPTHVYDKVALGKLLGWTVLATEILIILSFVFQALRQEFLSSASMIVCIVIILFAAVYALLSKRFVKEIKRPDDEENA